MKKKITSLALVLALCLSLLPVTVFAEEEAEVPAEELIRTHISTVAELQAFATEVNNGAYDGKTDAVVSLDADLDLNGTSWVPIGSNFDNQGNLQHYFSGKFYGNGHTISNLNFSENYGKSDYPSFGFFSEIYGAEVSDLTIEGTLEVDSEQEYTFFGVFTGVASDCTFSNCVSNVIFKNNDNRVYGTFGLIGYAIDTTVEYCRNVADITITGDMGSLYVGGIVGFAESNKGISKISYCSNTGDMTLAAPHGSGIVGQLGGKSQVSNCYSTGKLIPIGNTEIGGIAGTVGSSATVNHCYYFGDIDLSQFTNDKSELYSRFGGIVGYSSNSAIYQNNYYADTENVTACGLGINASTVGIAKQSNYMETKDFYDTLKNGGGDYIYVEGSTPILPAPKYTVSFDITPADNLTGVTVKIGEERLPLDSKEISLAAGSYIVTVDGTEFKQEIAITADRATHTQTLDLTADYTAVNAAIEKANALNESDYKNFDTVKAAIAAVVRDKNIAQQAEVDAMAKAIENAITGLVRKSSGSSRPRYDVTTPSKPENGSVTVDPERARSGSRVMVTVTPDSGYKLGELVVTDKDGKKLELTDKGNGQYTFTMPSGKVEVAAEFVKEVEVSPFADVATDAYYYDAVKWAVEKGVTNGVSETLFGPDQACTRAQIVTFLWRAAGSPEPKSGSSFADVAADAYYAKAVAWAMENGITKGTSETTFHPDETCTRAQGVTFLYRALGKLAAAQAGFTDVAADSYYADAVNWAAENGVTNGISETLFGPDGSCTRAQIVTFLYRAYQGK